MCKQNNADRKQIRFGEMLDRINAARGKQSLAGWVKDACETKLRTAAKSSPKK